jgi:hypothetical protein
MTYGRRNIDNAAGSLHLHHAQFMFQAEEYAEHIGIEGGGIALRGLRYDRARRALGAGVVDGDVETTEPGDSLVHQILYVILVANVGANELSLGTERAELRGQRLTGVVAAAGNDEIGAFFREGGRGGAADTGQGTSDEDNRTGHVKSPLRAIWKAI